MLALAKVGALLATLTAVAYAYLFRNPWPKLRQALYFPLAGKLRWEHSALRKRLLHRFQAENVNLSTTDGRIVHAVWAQPPRTRADARRASSPVLVDTNDDNGRAVAAAATATAAATAATDPPTALLLHANAMVLDDMSDWAHYYLSLGFSVLSITFWGYPDPAEAHIAIDASGEQLEADDGRFCPSERSLYLDAEAALRYLREVQRRPAERIVVHGLSIGGAAACALGARHTGLTVTVDQTFASMRAVSAHVGKGLYEQLVLQRAYRALRAPLRAMSPCVLALASRLVVGMSFNGVRSASDTGRDCCCEADGLDNVRKAARIRGPMFVIYAEHDEMMPTRFAMELLAARYGRDGADDRRATHSMCVPGGHCTFFGHMPELAARYRSFLREQGLLDHVAVVSPTRAV